MKRLFILAILMIFLCAGATGGTGTQCSRPPDKKPGSYEDQKSQYEKESSQKESEGSRY